MLYRSALLMLLGSALGACSTTMYVPGPPPPYGYAGGGGWYPEPPRYIPQLRQHCNPDTFDPNGVRVSHCWMVYE